MAEDQDGIVVGSGDGSDGPPPFKMPSQEELLAAVEKMTGLSDEDRQQLIDGILGKEKLGDGHPAQEVVLQGQNISVELFVLLSMIAIVSLIFVFFGYKLYKSLVERERRREEKKRQKLQKKKK